MLFLLILVEIYLVLFKSLDCVCYVWWFLLFVQIYGQALGRPGRPHLGKERAKTKKSSKRAKRKQWKTDIQKTAKTITHKGSNVFPIIVKHANHDQEMDFREGLLEAFSSPSVGERKRSRSLKSLDFPVVSETFGCLFGQWQLGSAKKTRSPKRPPRDTLAQLDASSLGWEGSPGLAPTCAFRNNLNRETEKLIGKLTI